MDLRGLSIGEIFDRSITIYVRHAVVFTLIVLTVLAPIAVLRYFTIEPTQADFARMIAQIEHPSPTPFFPFTAQQYGALFGIALITLLLAPFTNNAVAVGVAAIYAGRQPSYTLGFARVLRRWLPLLGTGILCFLIVATAYVAMVFAAIVPLFVGILVARSSTAATLVVLLLGAAVGIALLLVFFALVICLAFALYATTIEDKSPGEAIASAFRRIFNRREFRKVLLVALCTVVLQFGALIVSAVVESIIVLVLHSTALDEAFSTIVNAMLTAFVTILVAVYYYDVRIRTEGLDLEVDVERLASAT